MKGINRTLTAGMVAGLATLAPTLATASVEQLSDNTAFHALSTLQQSELMTLDAMSENELGSIHGEFFNFGFNIAIAPQLNICIICNGVNQTNIGSIFGFNMFP